MDENDRARVPESGWLSYLDGNNPGYPVDALRQDFEALRGKMEAMRSDTTTPDTRMSDDMNEINPAITGTLTQLMLGGLPTGRVGYPLHCRLRYFDPERRRAGVPEDVAALVQGMTQDEVTVTFVNLNLVKSRKMIVQGGAYAEHQIISASVDGVDTLVNHSHFAVTIEPGCGSRVVIKMQRYANQPTMAFPWV
jgi:hypothetical protein